MRGGKIIDWDFPEFQEVRDFHNCKGKAKYRLENKDIRRKMKNDHIIQNRANILKIKEENGEDWAELLNDFPHPYKCGFNVIMEGREPPEYYNIQKELIKLCKVYTKRLGVENAVKMINKEIDNI